MLKKKLFAAGAAAAVVAAIAAPTAAFAEYLGFTDIPVDHWAAESQASTTPSDAVSSRATMTPASVPTTP